MNQGSGQGSPTGPQPPTGRLGWPVRPHAPSTPSVTHQGRDDSKRGQNGPGGGSAEPLCTATSPCYLRVWFQEVVSAGEITVCSRADLVKPPPELLCPTSHNGLCSEGRNSAGEGGRTWWYGGGTVAHKKSGISRVWIGYNPQRGALCARLLAYKPKLDTYDMIWCFGHCHCCPPHSAPLPVRPITAQHHPFEMLLLKVFSRHKPYHCC